ncbi:hypothetical protein NHH03_27725 [Stieleria sp. TO1_6]|uniref:hypothetical protein n=1 Tax=Stieleria tagensis TaxID=2956795 RepID=UPI00209ADAB5|nr:hypothetical protein [Stieleria tagensis]MCO8125560.1 hypothetical protein [Stieleria tagensis]
MPEFQHDFKPAQLNSFQLDRFGRHGNGSGLSVQRHGVEVRLECRQVLQNLKRATTVPLDGILVTHQLGAVFPSNQRIQFAQTLATNPLGSERPASGGCQGLQTLKPLNLCHGFGGDWISLLTGRSQTILRSDDSSGNSISL